MLSGGGRHGERCLASCEGHLFALWRPPRCSGGPEWLHFALALWLSAQFLPLGVDLGGFNLDGGEV